MSCSTGTIIHNSTTNKNQFPPQISDPASAQLFLTTCRYYSCTWYLKYGLTGPAYGKRVTPYRTTRGPQADHFLCRYYLKYRQAYGNRLLRTGQQTDRKRTASGPQADHFLLLSGHFLLLSGHVSGTHQRDLGCDQTGRV